MKKRDDIDRPPARTPAEAAVSPRMRAFLNRRRLERDRLERSHPRPKGTMPEATPGD